MSEFYNNHYIDVDDKGRILDGWSDGPHRDRDTTNTICINEHGGYQFRISPGAEENPSLRTTDGIPLYKWEREQVMARTEEEIAADRAAISPPPPSEQEQLRADVDFLAAMQGDSSVSVFELAKKYYPRLWNKLRLETLVLAGRLIKAEIDEITD